ncbi:sensor histidine kinase [Terriglobus roseus]|uniref:sensor histidine kinase n=1 Tax=Terriglobus roseus TaxID=392734 RepID=UPI00147C6B4B|nr:sensor histidine kinase [Terriglobus roseus]
MTFEAYTPIRGVLPDGAASHLLVTPDGGLWISYTGGRIAYLKDGVSRTYTEADGYAYGATRAIARTHDGAIWAAVTGGLTRFDGTSWHRVRKDWDYPESSALCVFVDRQDTLWVGTGSSLRYLPSGSHAFLDRRIPIYRIVAVRESRDGVLWLSDGDKEVVRPFRSPLERATSDPLPEPISIGSWDILFPSDGSLLLGSEHGVRRFPSAAHLSEVKKDTAAIAETFSRKDGATGQVIRRLLEDREGNIWAATDGGLDRFRPRRLSWTETGYSPTPVAAADGSLFVVYDTDLPPELLPSHKPVPFLPDTIRAVASALHSGDGSTWFLGLNNTWRWKNGTVAVFPYPKYDSHSKIYALDVDNAGTIWVSISGLGLMKLMGSTWTNVPVLPHDPDIAPTSVKADGHGQIWLGYDARQRVALIQNGVVSHVFGPADGLAVGTVSTVSTIGSDVWVGGTGGLEVLQGTRFIPVTAIDRTPFPAVHRIMETAHDGLWLSTGRSILHIFQDDLQAYLADHTKGVKYEILDTETDLPEPLSIAPGSSDWSIGTGVTASTPSRELHQGKLWFSTISGIATVDLAHLQRNAMVPPVSITSVSTDQLSYPTNDTVLLPPNTRSFNVAYTALSLTNASRNRFKVRLDGWDKQWQDVGNHRESTYANLAPGTYVFHVIASNNDGVWNTTGSAITIRVLPAYYQTNWFRMMCLVFLLALGWLLYTWRVNHLVRRSNALMMERLSERERIAHDLHDTLFQGVEGGLLSIHAVTSRIELEPSSKQRLQFAFEEMNRVMASARSLVFDSRKQFEPRDFDEIIRGYGEDIGQMSDAQFQVKTAGTKRVLKVAASEEILKIVKEGLNNAFRHARATNVCVEIDYTRSTLLVCVWDDGTGIDPRILEEGGRQGHWGMPSMRRRAEEAGAELKISLRKHGGTEVHIRMRAGLAFRSRALELSARWFGGLSGES